MWLARVGSERIDETDDPQTFSHSKAIAKKGGTVAGNTRKDIENKLGDEIVSRKNASEIRFIEKKRIGKR